MRIFKNRAFGRFARKAGIGDAALCAAVSDISRGLIDADMGGGVVKQRSRVMASIHETAEGLHGAGLMDKQTMRKFDETCLTPVHPLAPEAIRKLREREGASQAVFARYLNVTVCSGR